MRDQSSGTNKIHLFVGRPAEEVMLVLSMGLIDSQPEYDTEGIYIHVAGECSFDCTLL